MHVSCERSKRIWSQIDWNRFEVRCEGSVWLLTVFVTNILWQVPTKIGDIKLLLCIYGYSLYACDVIADPLLLLPELAPYTICTIRKYWQSIRNHNQHAITINTKSQSIINHMIAFMLFPINDFNFSERIKCFWCLIKKV